MSDRLPADDATLLADIRQAEGLRLKAYPDPKTKAAPWTLGYGHTGPEVGPTTTCTLAQAESWLRTDVADAMSVLDAEELWWRETSLGRQRVFSELCFNMGFGHLSGFHRMLADAEAGRWAGAAHELLNSEWALDVGDERAQRLSRGLAQG